MSENATTLARFVKSYEIRRAYQGGVQYPPAVGGVAGAIDIHCHADAAHQDALSVAKLASKNGMRGILYKSIAGKQRAESVRKIREALQRWCDEEKIAPTLCWSGCNVANRTAPPSVTKVREQLDAGVDAVWMPVAMHANTLSKIGGRKSWWDSTAGRGELTPALSWEEALKVGHYALDEHGKLKQEIKDIIKLLVDRGKPLFFGHATHPEIYALAEECQRAGQTRAVIDHPFSPFVNLSAEQMTELGKAGVYLNFTYDEISPLLGVDPFDMYKAIRSIGVEHVTLSSDCGEPLFPNSVEGIRQMRAYMEAFGLSKDEIKTVSCDNPARIVGLPLAA
jgi:hypothetical protein